MNLTVQSGPKTNLNTKQRFAYGIGNVFTELFRQLYMSFTIVFVMQVVGLPASHAGVVLLVGQLTYAIISPINGYLGDRVRIPLISKQMGRRKSWHLLGTILSAVSLPLLYNGCFFCSKFNGISWLPLVYYACLFALLGVAYNMLEINNLAIVSVAAGSIQEGATLNAIRTVLSFLSGIYIYLVAWGLLGQDSGDDLGPENLAQFANLAWITIGTGVMFTIIFYIGAKEPKNNFYVRKISTLMDPAKIGGLIQAGQSAYLTIFENDDDNKRESSTLAQTFIEMVKCPVKSEEGENEAWDGTKELDVRMRKTSLLQRFVNALFQNEYESNNAASAEEPQLSEPREANSIERPAKDLIAEVGKLNQERKKSLLVRFIDGLVYTTHHSQPETSLVTVDGEHVGDGKDDENQGANSFEDEQTEFSACRNDISEKEQMQGVETRSESTSTMHNGREEATIRSDRNRKRGVAMVPEDFHEPGIFNLAYQNEDIGISLEEDEGSVGRSHEDDMPTLTYRGRSRTVSFFDESHTASEEENAICNPEPSNFEVDFDKTLTKIARSRTVSFADEIQNESETAREEENTISNPEPKTVDVTCKPAPKQKSPKTAKDWLVDPRLYKVAVIFTCSRLVQDAAYAYLPLYLTEVLGFKKEAVAYFPLVLLVSAALGSTVSDKINRKIGSKWLYLAASLLVTGASVYCYFQTPSLKQSTYAPVILLGGGMSIMYVMALVFITELIGDDKEASGWVFSIIVFISGISSGGMFMAIQEFYPDNDSVSNASIANYVRHVFSMVLGILALAGSLVVLFFQPPMLCSTRREYSLNEDAPAQTESSTTAVDVVVIS